mmetsp:Transcript_49332/g.127256  ORF Transcript_49332/g.127256 Transcript_49332/m.127256 type:complete len:250 (+) Transcript_49332:1247-1996(+)
MKSRRRRYAANFSRRARSSSSVLTRPPSRSALTVLARSRVSLIFSISTRFAESCSRHRTSCSSSSSIFSSACSIASSNSFTLPVSSSFSSLRSTFCFSSCSFLSFRSSSSSAILSTVSLLSSLASSSSFFPTTGSASPLSMASRIFFAFSSISVFLSASSSRFDFRSTPARAKVFFVATLESRGYTGQPQCAHSTHLGTVSGSGSTPSGEICISTNSLRSCLAFLTRHAGPAASIWLLFLTGIFGPGLP